MAKDTLEIKVTVSSEVVRWATETNGAMPNMLRPSLEAQLGAQAVESAVKLLEEEDAAQAERENNVAAEPEKRDADAPA